MPRFEDMDGFDELEAVDLRPENEKRLNGHKIVTYGQLHKNRCPNERLHVKVPTDVLEFIREHAEDGAVQGLILARMLEVGAAYVKKKLVLGDYEIKY